MSACGKWTYDTVARKSSWEDNKEPHYTTSWSAGTKSIVECVHLPMPPSNNYARRPQAIYRRLTPGMPLRVVLRSNNSTQLARRVQAELLTAAGYRGPIKSGEVKALKNLLAKIGKTDHVIHGWILKKKKNRYFHEREYLHGPCYVFKSPIAGLDFTDFIMLARMYRDGAGLKQAVGELMKRVPEELKTEAETFRTMDVLAGLGEKTA